MIRELSENEIDKANSFAEEIQSSGEQRVIPVAQPTSFRDRANRHFRRFWWLHLIIFCAAVLIIALCLVYVAMPKIAQAGVNDSSLMLYDLQFLNPTTDTITITETAGINSPSIYTPTLEPFTVGFWLVTNGTFGPQPFTNIDFPSIHVRHPTSNISIASQILTITDQDQLANYATQVLLQENITSALTGSTKLDEGKLPVITIKYNSTTTYKALNGLQGFNITNLRFNISAGNAQPNLICNAFIPNPSILTVEMGNITLSLSTTQSGIVGNATLKDFTLRPGDNNLPMTAVVDEAAILKSQNASGFVTMHITGVAAVFNSQHIPYYEKALANLKLSLDLNIKDILADSYPGL